MKYENIIKTIKNNLTYHKIITGLVMAMPLLTSILPMIVVRSALITDLNFEIWEANIMALVIEGLGAASMLIFHMVKRHNKMREHKATDYQVSTSWPVAAYIIYMATMLVIVVAIKLDLEWIHWAMARDLIMHLMLVTFSLPGVMLAATTYQMEDTAQRSIKAKAARARKREQNKAAKAEQAARAEQAAEQAAEQSRQQSRAGTKSRAKADYYQITQNTAGEHRAECKLCDYKTPYKDTSLGAVKSIAGHKGAHRNGGSVERVKI